MPPRVTMPPSSFAIAPGHPSLPGHFPGRPVVPGVVLLDHAARQALAGRPGERLAGIALAKFLRPVRPGERLDLDIRECQAQRLEVTARLEGGAVAFRATFILAPCAMPMGQAT